MSNPASPHTQGSAPLPLRPPTREGSVLELNGDRRTGTVQSELIGSIDTASPGVYADLDVASYYATRGILNDVDATAGPIGYTAL